MKEKKLTQLFLLRVGTPLLPSVSGSHTVAVLSYGQIFTYFVLLSENQFYLLVVEPQNNHSQLSLSFSVQNCM
jgi:hypothetical protein